MFHLLLKAIKKLSKLLIIKVTQNYHWVNTLTQ